MTSGSGASIRREAAEASLALPSTPSGSTTRTTLPTVAESDVVVRHNFPNRQKQESEIGLTGVARFVLDDSNFGLDRRA